MHIHTNTPARTAFLLLCIFIVTLLAGMGIGKAIVRGSLSAQVTSTGSTASIRRALRQERLSKLRKARTPARRYIRRGVPMKAIVRPVRTRVRRDTGSTLHEAPAERTPIKAGCGDTLVLFEETCDDGNTINNDGCSSTCTVEHGYVCNGSQPSSCWSTCGDGAVAYDERCDDGNLTGGDGCSGVCRVESLYRCSGSPSVCEIPVVCGDSNKEGTEACDDGNITSGDGCSSSCTIE